MTWITAFPPPFFFLWGLGGGGCQMMGGRGKEGRGNAEEREELVSE